MALRPAFVVNLPAAIAAFVIAITSLAAETAIAADFQTDAAQPLANLYSETSARQATDALRLLLTAFENGDSAKVEAGIEPTLVGLTALLKSIQDSHALQREIRIHLQDTKVTVGSDNVLIYTDWEKRFLSVSKSAPGLAKGRITFVFRRAVKQWKLVGMTGDNLFAGGI